MWLGLSQPYFWRPELLLDGTQVDPCRQRQHHKEEEETSTTKVSQGKQSPFAPNVMMMLPTASIQFSEVARGAHHSGTKNANIVILTLLSHKVMTILSPAILTSDNFVRSNEIIKTKWPIYVIISHFVSNNLIISLDCKKSR